MIQNTRQAAATDTISLTALPTPRQQHAIAQRGTPGVPGGFPPPENSREGRTGLAGNLQCATMTCSHLSAVTECFPPPADSPEGPYRVTGNLQCATLTCSHLSAVTRCFPPSEDSPEGVTRVACYLLCLFTRLVQQLRSRISSKLLFRYWVKHGMRLQL